MHWAIQVYKFISSIGSWSFREKQIFYLVQKNWESDIEDENNG